MTKDHLRVKKTFSCHFVMVIVWSQKCGSSTAYFGSSRSLRVTVPSHSYNTGNDISVAQHFHVLIPTVIQPNCPRPCCLQFGALGGFVWRESNSFGWLRQALVHVQSRNSRGRLPRPSSCTLNRFDRRNRRNSSIW